MQRQTLWGGPTPSVIAHRRPAVTGACGISPLQPCGNYWGCVLGTEGRTQRRQRAPAKQQQEASRAQRTGWGQRASQLSRAGYPVNKQWELKAGRLQRQRNSTAFSRATPKKRKSKANRNAGGLSEAAEWRGLRREDSGPAAGSVVEKTYSTSLRKPSFSHTDLATGLNLLPYGLCAGNILIITRQ